jgi:hypothetical protein
VRRLISCIQTSRIQYKTLIHKETKEHSSAELQAYALVRSGSTGTEFNSPDSTFMYVYFFFKLRGNLLRKCLFLFK